MEPVKHYGYCMSRYCSERMCSSFEPSPAPLERNCLHCTCPRHLHLCVGISVGDSILDLTYAKPVEKIFPWEEDEKFTKNQGTSTEESLTSVLSTDSEPGPPSVSKTPRLSRYHTPNRQAFEAGRETADGKCTLLGMQYLAYGPDRSIWPTPATSSASTRACIF